MHYRQYEHRGKLFQNDKMLPLLHSSQPTDITEWGEMMS